MSDGTTTWNYTYDKDGLRLSRSDGTTTYNYVYLGSQLKRMSVGSTEIYFAYDSDGSPMSMVYNGTTYYYVKNLQGDVVGIVTKSGEWLASYTYDAWGNPLETTVSESVTNAAAIAANNPLRYRGYVYDSETGLYYLQSRYYNPEIGRFLNADALISTGQGLLGNNMFAYCGNNPVYRIDLSGTAYEEQEEYRVVGAGIQLEIDVGNVTVGIEIIVYWDVDECGEHSVVIATYTYSGGSINLCDEFAGSIMATVRDNLDLITSGTEEGITALIGILERNYSASASGLLLLGNEYFNSVKSYEGLFMSMYGSVNHVKGAVAVSNSCIAIAIGGTSSKTPSWGISITNYSLQSTIIVDYVLLKS